MGADRQPVAEPAGVVRTRALQIRGLLVDDGVNQPTQASAAKLRRASVPSRVPRLVGQPARGRHGLDSEPGFDLASRGQSDVPPSTIGTITTCMKSIEPAARTGAPCSDRRPMRHVPAAGLPRPLQHLRQLPATKWKLVPSANCTAAH